MKRRSPETLSQQVNKKLNYAPLALKIAFFCFTACINVIFGTTFATHRKKLVDGDLLRLIGDDYIIDAGIIRVGVSMNYY